MDFKKRRDLPTFREPIKTGDVMSQLLLEDL